IAAWLRLGARPDGHQATRPLPATAKDINLSAHDPIIQPARAQWQRKRKGEGTAVSAPCVPIA
ncbi:MAG: hypothetical protein ABI548_23810, partial [Polyangiaceae bacterium]